MFRSEACLSGSKQPSELSMSSSLLFSRDIIKQNEPDYALCVDFPKDSEYLQILERQLLYVLF
jgi:hypothetical protein